MNVKRKNFMSKRFREPYNPRSKILPSIIFQEKRIVRAENTWNYVRKLGTKDPRSWEF